MGHSVKFIFSNNSDSEGLQFKLFLVVQEGAEVSLESVGSLLPFRSKIIHMQGDTFGRLKVLMSSHGSAGNASNT